jgi:hypothetical protein
LPFLRGRFLFVSLLYLVGVLDFVFTGSHIAGKTQGRSKIVNQVQKIETKNEVKIETKNEVKIV